MSGSNSKKMSGNNIRNIAMANKRSDILAGDIGNLTKEQIENVIEWTTFFRRNPEIYVDMVLGIKLYPFQKVLIHMLVTSDVFYAICARGFSKF